MNLVSDIILTPCATVLSKFLSPLIGGPCGQAEGRREAEVQVPKPPPHALQPYHPTTRCLLTCGLVRLVLWDVVCGGGGDESWDVFTIDVIQPRFLWNPTLVDFGLNDLQVRTPSRPIHIPRVRPPSCSPQLVLIFSFGRLVINRIILAKYYFWALFVAILTPLYNSCASDPSTKLYYGKVTSCTPSRTLLFVQDSQPDIWRG